jgi:hypothetical protein
MKTGYLATNLSLFVPLSLEGIGQESAQEKLVFPQGNAQLEMRDIKSLISDTTIPLQPTD